MKTAIFIVSIIIILLFISCRQPNAKKTAIVDYKDSTKTFVEKKEQEKIDSTNDDEILTGALKIAEQNKAHIRFKKNHVASIPGSSYLVDIDISSDFYFTNRSLS
jgi:hypothetical protein